MISQPRRIGRVSLRQRETIVLARLACEAVKLRCNHCSTSRQVLANAAHAMAGMVKTTNQTRSKLLQMDKTDNKPALGITMYGVTTTEVADRLVGGVFAASDDRFSAFNRRRILHAGSLVALDMVNFHAHATVPGKNADRLFDEHDPQVTLKRTTVSENCAISNWIAQRLNRMAGPQRTLTRLPYAIKDAVFANAIFAALHSIHSSKSEKRHVQNR